MLGRDVGVLHLVGFRLRALQSLLRLPRQADLGGAVHGGEVVEALVELGPYLGGAHTDALEYRGGKSALLVEQSDHEVLGLHLGVAPLDREFLGGGEGLLCFQCESFQLHLYQCSS